MPEKAVTHAVFLTCTGSEALKHLEDFLRDGRILDCTFFESQAPFVEVRAKLQVRIAELEDDPVEAHLLFPHAYIAVVAIDIGGKQIGFQGTP